ncbi:MAG: UDP-2,3-diacylglucosamine diphosphatase LpxI [Elusimicrobia bacterium]|nr:UDP-2,3-diacylglucosamine diphosphatase LpxI [Elusimicrobiota bacterium]
MNLPQKIGIISGRGKFPILIAEEIKKYSGNTGIYATGFKGETNNKIKQYVKEFQLFEFGALGKAIDYFKLKKVDKAIIAGLISHKRLFDKNLKLDSVMQGILDNIKDKKADSILGGIANALKTQGIELLQILPILENNLAKKGILTESKPDIMSNDDINFGFPLAKELSRHDIGQTIVVKNKCVIAIEALEGTDICIIRSGKMAGPGTVIIKVAKLHQDLRFDLPVIGTRTIKNMKKIKSKTLAIEAGKTCIINKEEVFALADKYGISIVGV